MSYRKISAFINKDKKEELISALRENDISGFNFHKVKGEGEFKLNKSDKLREVLALDIYAQTKNVDKIKQLIVNVASTGEEGDGIICVSQVEEIVRIRNNESIDFEDE